jgi:hypothetical protein
MTSEAKIETSEEPKLDKNTKFAGCILVALETCTDQRWGDSGGKGRGFGRSGEDCDVWDRTVDIVEAASAKLKAGDLGAAEEVLANQTLALDEIFNQFARLAVMNPPLLHHFMKTALKAQSQCRATVKNLAALRNPPLVRDSAKKFRNSGKRTIGKAKTRG